MVTVRRLKGALDTSFEPLAADSDTLDIEAEIQELEIDIAGHIHKLKALAGMQQDENLEVRKVSPKPLRLGLPDTLGLDLIARRPDLIALRRHLEAAGKEVVRQRPIFIRTSICGLSLGRKACFGQSFSREIAGM